MSPKADGATSADVVVVGGGIVGICTALSLQRSGRVVTVVERSSPGAQASGHNGGVFAAGECVPTGMPGVIRSVPRMLRDPAAPLVLRYSYLPRLAPWLVRFALASTRRRVERISVALQSLTDRALGAYDALLADTPAARAVVHEGGLLHVYRTSEAFAGDRSALELRSRRGVAYEILDDAAIGAIDPALTGRFRRAYYLPAARFTTDPEGLAQALAAHLVASGGSIRSAEVRGFELRNSRVRAVTTDKGAIKADAVVVAAGPWSRPLVRQLGLKVPLDTERGYGFDLPDPGVTLRQAIIVNDVHIAMVPHREGLRISGIDELAGVSAPPDYKAAERVLRGAKTVFPELWTGGGTRWMHRRPSLPDSLPIIGRAPRYANAFLAFGHGHKGLCLAAITGQLVRELADGQEPSIDLEPFEPTRFSLRRHHHGLASTGGRTDDGS